MTAPVDRSLHHPVVSRRAGEQGSTVSTADLTAVCPQAESDDANRERQDRSYADELLLHNEEESIRRALAEPGVAGGVSRTPDRLG